MGREDGLSPMAESFLTFANHVQNSDMDSASRPEQYLGHWFVDWLKNGDGVEFTGRSYENYLRVCLHVADAVVRGELKLDSEDNEQVFYPRKIVGIDDPDDPSHYDDRLLYEVSVTRWEHQRRGILTIEEGQAPMP